MYDINSHLEGQYFWWLRADRSPVAADPTNITGYWKGLPKNLTKVDAVYESPDTRKVIFFIGQLIYSLNHDTTLERGYPKTLSSIGIR